MWSETALLILGVMVFLSPFIGFPLSILSWLLPIVALGIIALSYQLRTKRSASSPPPISVADRTPFFPPSTSH